MHSRGNFENSWHEEPHPILCQHAFAFDQNSNMDARCVYEIL